MISTFFLCFLTSHRIDYKDYDYIEGKTNENFQDKNSRIIKYKRYYENPFLWSLLFSEPKYKKGFDYLIENYKNKIDINIINSLIEYINEQNSSLFFRTILEYYLRNSKEKSKDMDSIMLSAIVSNRLDIFDKLIKISNTLNIEPLYGNFANVSNGQGLLELTRNEDIKGVQKLLDLGADPTLEDSISFIMACKHGYYKIALMLQQAGADIHSKNNLGLKMIQRNEKNKSKIVNNDNKYKEESEKNQLLLLYEIE